MALGDSITDGYGGLPATGSGPWTENPAGIDLDVRWPDALQHRLIAAGRPLSILNAGISGNHVLADGTRGILPFFSLFGPSALQRLGPDVLSMSGVTDVIVLEGINDIDLRSPVPPAQLIAGLTELVQAIHASGLHVQLGTLTRIGGSPVDSPGHDAERAAVNAWIRSQRLSDGVVDFDRAVRDPADPTRLLAADDSGDGIHPSPAGYAAMAAAVPFSRLRAPSCSAPRHRVKRRSARSRHRVKRRSARPR